MSDRPFALFELETLLQEQKRGAQAYYEFLRVPALRELSNVLERVLSSLEGSTIRLSDLPFYLYRGRKIASKLSAVSIREVQSRAEMEAILHSLRLARYNKSKAAAMLGIHRTHLYKKIKKYGITRPSNEDSQE